METCSKCGRPLEPRTEGILYGVRPSDPCPGPEYISCRIAAEAFRRGLREGLAICKAKAKHAKLADWNDSRKLVDLSDAEAEVERRCV